MSRFWIFLITLVSTMSLTVPATQADMVKWIDEDGKVHFSDTPPTNTKIKSELVPLKEAPKQGLTDAELAEKKKKVDAYKQSVFRNDKAGEGVPAQIRQAPDLSNIAPPTPTAKPAKVMTRSECRDTYQSNTAARVNCFKSASP
ncbi:DUF4124 domain-containing protein [Teredinibacter waterburyi]|jgi:hypothetical protein|uniref:DUF4124 domain-containing protein n=1 Tax=Teredinibacter waterburyi TaxID=1500538 RepID=UPI00165FD78E|nr:DUF4124 domain-containing protein [Teredinibacter waterburyi]